MAAKLTSELKRDARWHEFFGIHAAADAINAGIVSSQEAEALRHRQFSDRVQRVSFSPFNEYFLLYAMSSLGLHDEALTATRDCWGGQIDYGATTFLECYDPSWNAFLKPNDPLPSGQCGGTSLCHPWSSGITKWLSEEVLGIKPTSPGFSTVSILPHLGATLTQVSGAVPTPHGQVFAAFDVKSGKCEATLPSGTVGTLGIPKAGRRITDIRLNGVPVWNGTNAGIAGDGKITETSEFVKFHSLPSGNYVFEIAYSGQPPVWNEPRMNYPLGSFKVDSVTQGDWGGKYGKDGHVLFGWEGTGKDRAQLPTYVHAVTPASGRRRLDAVWQSGTGDHRALAGSVTNGNPRNAACIHGTMGNPDLDLTMHVDVTLSTNVSYNLALYFVDWDRKGRSLSVQVRDLNTLDLIAPIQMVSDFVGGKYLIFRCDRSVRLRLDPIRGDNAVLSGIFFDPSPAEF